MSRLDEKKLERAVEELLRFSKERQKRNFVETIDLQIALKNIDIRSERRFHGSIVLDTKTKYKRTCCVFGNQADCERAKELGVDYKSIDDLKAINKDKKTVKKLAKQYDFFLASASLIRMVPRILGPGLTKKGKFPTPIKPEDDLQDVIDERERTVKFLLKKRPNLRVSIGHVDLEKEEIIKNTVQSLNFLVTLTRKGWNNIGSVYLNSSMGPPCCIY